MDRKRVDNILFSVEGGENECCPLFFNILFSVEGGENVRI